MITYIYVSRPCQQRWPQDDDQSASLAETETLQRLLNGLTWKILKSETIIISRGWLLMSLVISWLLFSATCRPKFFPRPLKYLHITNNVVQTFMLPDSVSCWQWCSPEPFVERNQAVDIRGFEWNVFRRIGETVMTFCSDVHVCFWCSVTRPVI